MSTKTSPTSDSGKNDLSVLLSAQSKHSSYQEIHPSLERFLSNAYKPSGKSESIRWSFMTTLTDFKGKNVVDIGANTGFFTFAAIVDENASSVRSYEGNPNHAEFIKKSAMLLGVDEKIQIENSYYDFFSAHSKPVDILLCLNVLHHIGDDFGDQKMSIRNAKEEIVKALNELANRCQWMWFQLGFNWQGNSGKPLFVNGKKMEMIEFISQATQKSWVMEAIAVYNPVSKAYEHLTDELLKRDDAIGEFLNRPLFLLRSLKS